MAKTPEEKVYKELKSFPSVPRYTTEKTEATFHVRLVEANTDPKTRIDVREYIKSLDGTRYSGYTGRGLALTVDQAKQLIASIEQAILYTSAPAHQVPKSKKAK